MQLENEIQMFRDKCKAVAFNDKTYIIGWILGIGFNAADAAVNGGVW